MGDVSIGLNSGPVSVSVTSQPSPSSFPKSNNGPSSSSIMGDEVCKFIAGGISGTLAKGAVSPFDRIKILRQGTGFIVINLKFTVITFDHILNHDKANIRFMANCH